MKSKVLIPFLSFCLVLSQWVKAQPTDNPYRSLYPLSRASHWTEVLSWSQIYNVTTFGATPNDGLDDLSAIRAAIDAAHIAGGGVVYFPAGTYEVSDSLILKSGVILRGETPAMNNAKDAAFSPPSKLVFPKYIYDTLANGGLGTPTNTAFKVITSTPEVKNIGVIYLDINRAGIEFHPEFDSLGMVSHAGGTTPNFQPRQKNRNILVLGVRSNNVAQPSLRVPDVSGPDKMRPWQRWYNYFVGNIDIYADENVSIVNNRLNDRITDNFLQPNYRVRNRCTNCTNYRNVGAPNNGTVNAQVFVPVLSPEHAEFDYSAHYGITLNRDKKVMTNGVRTIRQFIWYPEPAQEPSLYAKGFQIEDNWIYKTNRVGIWCAGLGLTVRNNIIKDTTINNSATWATPKKRWLDPNGGEVLRNFSATFENRGIDFGGSEIYIEGNDVLVSAADFPESQYGSIDGEGIMDQGNGGGTNPNGLYIRSNTVASNRDDCTNPTIGVYRTNGANNVVYENNVFTGNSRCMQIEADRGNNTSMTNVLVRNNSNIKSLIITAQGGGRNATAYGNTGTLAGGTMRLSCFVREFNNTNLTLQTAGCTPNNPGVPDTLFFPSARMVMPADSLTLSAAPSIFTFKAIAQGQSPDSVVFFLNAFERLGLGNINGDTASFDWALPTTDAQYKVCAYAYFTANGTRFIGKSAFSTLRIDDGNALTNNPQDIIGTSIQPRLKSELPYVIYPNPANSRVQIASADFYPDEITVKDLAGRNLIVTQLDNQRGFSIEPLKAGAYLVQLKRGTSVKTVKLLKQ